MYSEENSVFGEVYYLYLFNMFNINFNLIVTQVVGVVAYLSLIERGTGWYGRLFEARRLLTFSAFRMGAYPRWALIRGWAIIRNKYGS